MPAKIAIIEPFQHYEVMESVLRIMEIKNQHVLCICSSFCWEHSRFQDADWISWHLVKANESIDILLNQIHYQLQALDILFFITIDIHSSFWSTKNWQPKIYGIIHNANTFLNPWSNQVSLIKYKIKSLYYFLRLDFRKMKTVLDQLSLILVPSPSIENHLKGKLDSKYNNKIKSFPIAFPDLISTIHKRKQVHITIPGTLRQNQRDYQVLLKVLPIVDQQITRPTKIYILGKIASLEEGQIINQLKIQAYKNISIISFDDYVSPDEFDRCMKESDFLLLPIQPKVIYKSFIEHRSYTSVSGNINDLCKYALPALLPAYYLLHENLEQMVERYSSPRDLTKLLVNWIEHQEFNHRKQKSHQMLNTYKKNVLTELQKIMKILKDD